ncbi:MAG: STAS domain-containing protein [Leptospira sp.]|nr:STAS domain-containing protein [Leptospira sp.]
MINEHLSIEKKNIPNITLYSLSGRLDENSFYMLKDEIGSDEPKDNMILNLAHLKYISSSGIRALFEIKNKLENGGKKLILTEASENIIRIFSLLELWKSFIHYEKENEAIRSFSS